MAALRDSRLSPRSPDLRWSEAHPLSLFDAYEDALGEPREMAVAEDETLPQTPRAISSANDRASQLAATHVPFASPLIALRSTRAVQNGRKCVAAPEPELGCGPARSRNFASSRRNGACGTPALPSWPEDSKCRTNSRQS